MKEGRDSSVGRVSVKEGRDSSFGRASDQKARCDTDAGSILHHKRDVSPSESTFSADSLAVFVQPPCTIACISICASVKNPKHW